MKCASCGRETEKSPKTVACDGADHPVCAECWSAPWASWQTLYMRVYLRLRGKPVADVGSLPEPPAARLPIPLPPGLTLRKKLGLAP